MDVVVISAATRSVGTAKDIYFVDLPSEMESEGLTVLKGFIIPAPGETLPPSTILYVTDKSTGELKAYKPRQRDGVYVAILPLP